MLKRTSIKLPSRKAKEWQKANKWFGVDVELTHIALDAHVEILEQGIEVDSPKYYLALDLLMAPYLFDKKHSLRTLRPGDKIHR